MGNSIIQWARGHFSVLLAGFVFSRLILLPWRVSLLVGSDKHFDYRHFFELAALSDQGFYPLVHYWVEYPPMFPWLVVAAYRASAWVASGLALEAWFYTLTALLRLAGEVGTFVLLYRIARHLYGPDTAWKSAFLYAALFVPYYLWNGAFDPLPTFFLVSALYTLITQRAAHSALLAGIGLATKIFPAIVLPLAIAIIPGWKRKAAYTLVFLAVVAAFFVPFWLASPNVLLASLRTMLGRSSWETVWALLDNNYGPGGVASIGQRLDLASASGGGGTATWLWMLAVMALGAVYLWFYRRFWGQRGDVQVVAATGFTLHLFLLAIKGYSPQFLTWVAPLVAIIFPNRRGMVWLALLTFANLLEYPGYFHFFPDQRLLLAGAILLRTALLAAIAVAYLRKALETSTYQSAPRAALLNNGMPRS